MSYLIVLEEFFVEKQPAAGEEYHLRHEHDNTVAQEGHFNALSAFRSDMSITFQIVLLLALLS